MGAAAATSALTISSRMATALSADPSLTDGSGRFVVDPARATAGLADPLIEPTGAFSSISAALAVAPAGAVVIVKPGIYMERIVVQRGVQLLAEAGATLTWRSDKPYEAALTVDLSDATEPAQVLIAGLTLRHYSPSIAQNYAVYVPPPSSAAERGSIVTLRGCDVSSSSGSGVGVEGGCVDLVDCRVAGCKNHGVLYLGPSSRGNLRGCVLEKNKLNGVLLRDGAAPTLADNQLRANGQFGAALVDCRGAYLPSNQASANGKGAVSGECDAPDA